MDVQVSKSGVHLSKSEVHPVRNKKLMHAPAVSGRRPLLAARPARYFSLGFNSSGESFVYMFTGGAFSVKRWPMTSGSSVSEGRKSSLSI